MRRLLLVGLLVVFATTLASTEIRSLDYWWLLRTGQLIVETGSVPHVDPYSYTAPGAPYLDIHWLFQLVLYGVYRLGGHTGVWLWKDALVLVLAGFLLASCGRAGRAARPEWSAPAVAVALLLASGRFMPRAELPSFVLLAAVLWLLERDRHRGGAAVGWVVLLQWLWANMHGLFAVGIAACGAHLAGELLSPLLGSPIDRRRAARLAAVTAGSLAVAALGPNGFDTVLYPFLQLRMISQSSGFDAPWVVEIGRLLGPNADPGARALTLALAAASAAAMVADRRRLAASDAILWSGFLYLTLGAHRNQALFGIVAAPLFVRHLDGWLESVGEPRWLRPLATAAAATLLVAGTLDAARGTVHARVGDPRRPGLGIVEGLQPVAAVDWIERAHPPAPIFHAMSDGGYLIWRLYPTYRVMLDGRLEVYGRPLFQKLGVATFRAFEALDREMGFGTVLLNYRNQPFDDLLRGLLGSPQWRLTFLDDVAAVFVRETPDAPWPAVDVDDPKLFPPLPRTRDAADADFVRPRVLARVRFDYAAGRYERGLERWRDFLHDHPDEADETVLHAGLLAGAGRGAEARALVEDAVATGATSRVSPDDLLQLARLLGLLGDAAGARALHSQAIERDPTLDRREGRPTTRARVAMAARDRRESIQVGVETALSGIGCLALLGAAAAARRRRPRSP